MAFKKSLTVNKYFACLKNMCMAFMNNVQCVLKNVHHVSKNVQQVFQKNVQPVLEKNIQHVCEKCSSFIRKMF